MQGLGLRSDCIRLWQKEKGINLSQEMREGKMFNDKRTAGGEFSLKGIEEQDERREREREGGERETTGTVICKISLCFVPCISASVSRVKTNKAVSKQKHGRATSSKQRHVPVKSLGQRKKCVKDPWQAGPSSWESQGIKWQGLCVCFCVCEHVCTCWGGGCSNQASSVLSSSSARLLQNTNNHPPVCLYVDADHTR